MNHRQVQHISAIRIVTICAALIAVTTTSTAEAADKTSGTSPSISTNQNDNTLSIELDGRPALRYRFGDVKFKPCIDRWYTPGGTNILRDAPHDHLHHHAMMFAVAVDGVNFWEEKSPKSGKEVGQKPGKVVTKTNNGMTTAAFSQNLIWKDSDNKPLLNEQRTIELISANGLDASLVNWTTTLSPPDGKKSAQLGGRHYYGLGMRFVESMDNVGKMIAADGVKSRSVLGHAWFAPARWMAYTAPANGKTVTVAIFDHPQNPRYPGGVFHMTKPFAYLSATIGLGDKPYEVKAGKSLSLRYGAALWDGKVGTEKIEAAYRIWSKIK
ncbi:MAG: PmoA family protein [Pirellulales bacterium]|nr:PmoA family protein [Pirellulales bacterium]